MFPLFLPRLSCVAVKFSHAVHSSHIEPTFAKISHLEDELWNLRAFSTSSFTCDHNNTVSVDCAQNLFSVLTDRQLQSHLKNINCSGISFICRKVFVPNQLPDLRYIIFSTSTLSQRLWLCGRGYQFSTRTKPFFSRAMDGLTKTAHSQRSLYANLQKFLVCISRKPFLVDLPHFGRVNGARFSRGFCANFTSIFLEI